mmetsp:Transcript_30391/g.56072  ORF Transcript_30391/g.56072 Transcript_30391/m.56072 type:complete len:205 (+) Transcript_30391:1196-1810(+)
MLLLSLKNCHDLQCGNLSMHFIGDAMPRSISSTVSSLGIRKGDPISNPCCFHHSWTTDETRTPLLHRLPAHLRRCEARPYRCVLFPTPVYIAIRWTVTCLLSVLCCFTLHYFGRTDHQSHAGKTPNASHPSALQILLFPSIPRLFVLQFRLGTSLPWPPPKSRIFRCPFQLIHHVSSPFRVERESRRSSQDDCPQCELESGGRR